MLVLACVAGLTLSRAHAASQPAPRDPAHAPALKELFGERFLVGGAIEPWQLRHAADAALLKRHYNSITAENVMKPRQIAPGEGRYRFGPAERLVRFAEENGMKVRGHTLLWHRSAPDWFFAGDRSDVNVWRARVRARLERYITDVVTHFKGKVYAWDVVNEVASDEPGQVYRESSPWYQALGPDYIEYAFRAARAADPDVQLFINDYNTEHKDKRARLLTIVRDLQSKGVPLDGVGHQLHMQVGEDAQGTAEALREVAALGLINHVTELDVSIYEDPVSCFRTRTGCRRDYRNAVPEEALAAQAKLYGELFAVFRDAPALESVTTWGISDGHTWLNRFPVTRTNLPLLFDRSRAPKEAFWKAVESAE